MCSALYSVLLSEFRGLGRSCQPGQIFKGYISLKVESVYAIYNHSAIECFKVAEVEILLYYNSVKLNILIGLIMFSCKTKQSSCYLDPFQHRETSLCMKRVTSMQPLASRDLARIIVYSIAFCLLHVVWQLTLTRLKSFNFP